MPQSKLHIESHVSVMLVTYSVLITIRFTDVQTDVHIVPVDSDTPIRNLLEVQTVRCALVLYKGN